ncbi:HTH-type transcriptional regulator BetI [Pseudovibrio sp. Ad46]|uniref:TetR/AcrR family transcriptional regulator n=2 Tax=unclassified Pseudovibrio TaxID=2627060 RepID=UPI0007AE88F3|nr:TetR family transcriptional regulator C-terminal domain-containing protein [Pseudovibrio sp. Ad46]KZK88580.1 HTH-type transcriptional regulator BetI [Pseudovibrio sp. Ad46]KZK91198.1 HTH-type transcriptional regulator BetI [Pseudovibrio sp. Ad5]
MRLMGARPGNKFNFTATCLFRMNTSCWFLLLGMLTEMQDKSGKIRQENTDTRRADLIAATLRVIARGGVQSATVREIAAEANVTQGLIRYYFAKKDELIAAAYEAYMGNLVHIADEASRGEETAAERMSNFIKVSLEAPVTSHDSIAIWAGFFETLLHNEDMTESHERSYNLLRLHLKKLISDVLLEAGRIVSEQELRRLSIAGNAILDGLWLEGGALPHVFEQGELVQVGLKCFSSLLRIDLLMS